MRYRPPVQALSQVSDLLFNKHTYLLVEGRLIGWYKLKKGTPPDDDTPFNYNVITPSPMCLSVTTATYYIIHSDISSMECAFLRYKLDSYILAKSNVQRGELYNKGMVCVAASASSYTTALYNNTMFYVCDVEGCKLFHYIVPYLSGEDRSLSYDTYPIIQLGSKWCSVHDFANMQPVMSVDDIEKMVTIVEALADEYGLDLSTVELTNDQW